MSNRRRSERYEVALPVIIKGAKGDERTVTANISAHGIAVFSASKLPVHSYAELELRVPPDNTPVTVTAQVTRAAEVLRSKDGVERAGLAFDFYLFDSEGRAAWRAYIGELRAGPVEPPPPEPDESETASALPTGDGGAHSTDEPDATFIIKPRDLSRLRTFVRTELIRRRARIETPVLKDVGTLVELLLVHPDSDLEWPLRGTVVEASELGRGRGPMLEIDVEPPRGELEPAFKTFVDSGVLPDGGVPDPFDPETEHSMDALERPQAPVEGDPRVEGPGDLSTDPEGSAEGAFSNFFQEYEKDAAVFDEQETAPEQDALPLEPGERPLLPPSGGASDKPRLPRELRLPPTAGDRPTRTDKPPTRPERPPKE